MGMYISNLYCFLLFQELVLNETNQFILRGFYLARWTKGGAPRPVLLSADGEKHM